MPSKITAREEIEARIETLTGQRTRTLGELATSEEFGRKCHENIAMCDALIADWTSVLGLIDAA
jgi:hypothetical protein